jgi:hypothetical protein
MKHAVEMGSGAKFRKDWFKSSEVTQTHREHDNLINEF